MVERLTEAVAKKRAGESVRKMPIMLSTDMQIRRQRGERFVSVESIPWEIIEGEVTERASQRNHTQSLATIARRGGFDAIEAVCVLTSMTWEQGKSITEEQAHRILYMMTALYRRGVLAGRAAINPPAGDGGDHGIR